MKLGITGSRTIIEFDFSPYFRLIDPLFSAFCMTHGFAAIDTVITGGARGVDRIAANCAETLGLNSVVFRPDKKLCRGNRAAVMFHKRDEQIVAACDLLLAVWNGEQSSHGTLYTMDAALEDGKAIWLVIVQDGRIVSSNEQFRIIEFPNRARRK